jgi:hypothetical protein
VIAWSPVAVPEVGVVAETVWVTGEMTEYPEEFLTEIWTEVAKSVARLVVAESPFEVVNGASQLATAGILTCNVPVAAVWVWLELVTTG